MLGKNFPFIIAVGFALCFTPSVQGQIFQHGQANLRYQDVVNAAPNGGGCASCNAAQAQPQIAPSGGCVACSAAQAQNAPGNGCCPTGPTVPGYLPNLPVQSCCSNFGPLAIPPLTTPLRYDTPPIGKSVGRPLFGRWTGF